MVARPVPGRKLSGILFAIFTTSLIVLQMLAVLCALAQPAYAYADPGSGLLALQIMSTTFAGLIFMLRRRLRQLFGRRHPEPKSDDFARK